MPHCFYNAFIKHIYNFDQFFASINQFLIKILIYYFSAMKLLLVFSVIVGFTNALGRTQSVAIKGVLRCHDKPATNVKVKLYDTDSEFYISHLFLTGSPSLNNNKAANHYRKLLFP